MNQTGQLSVTLILILGLLSTVVPATAYCSAPANGASDDLTVREIFFKHMPESADEVHRIVQGEFERLGYNKQEAGVIARYVLRRAVGLHVTDADLAPLEIEQVRDPAPNDPPHLGAYGILTVHYRREYGSRASSLPARAVILYSRAHGGTFNVVSSDSFTGPFYEDLYRPRSSQEVVTILAKRFINDGYSDENAVVLANYILNRQIGVEVEEPRISPEQPPEHQRKAVHQIHAQTVLQAYFENEVFEEKIAARLATNALIMASRERQGMYEQSLGAQWQPAYRLRLWYCLDDGRPRRFDERLWLWINAAIWDGWKSSCDFRQPFCGPSRRPIILAQLDDIGFLEGTGAQSRIELAINDRPDPIWIDTSVEMMLQHSMLKGVHPDGEHDCEAIAADCCSAHLACRCR